MQVLPCHQVGTVLSFSEASFFYMFSFGLNKSSLLMSTLYDVHTHINLFFMYSSPLSSEFQNTNTLSPFLYTASDP